MMRKIFTLILLIFGCNRYFECSPYENGKYKKDLFHQNVQYYRPRDEGRYVPGNEGRYTYVYRQDGNYYVPYVHQVGPNGPDGSGGHDGLEGFGGQGGPDGPSGPNGPGGSDGPNGPSGTGGTDDPSGHGGPNGPSSPDGLLSIYSGLVIDRPCEYDPRVLIGSTGTSYEVNKSKGTNEEDVTEDLSGNINCSEIYGDPTIFAGDRNYPEGFPNLEKVTADLTNTYVTNVFIDSGNDKGSTYRDHILKADNATALKCRPYLEAEKPATVLSRAYLPLADDSSDTAGQYYIFKGHRSLCENRTHFKTIKIQYEILVRVVDEFLD